MSTPTALSLTAPTTSMGTTGSPIPRANERTSALSAVITTEVGESALLLGMLLLVLGLAAGLSSTLLLLG